MPSKGLPSLCVHDFGGLMKKHLLLLLAATSTFCTAPPRTRADDEIPKIACRRPIGQPLEDPGVRKNKTDIDDGYWQGAPVGGFGAGTFSRTYRGDFARWHIKTAVHKYAPVSANQFAMFQQVAGENAGIARVLTADHPKNGELSAWEWDYPVGAGEYAALFPKSWYSYKWDKFPANVVLEQFSPILPQNYKESSYPVAVYRWHAENPTNKPVTVSVMLSWTNMGGWFRTYTHDFKAVLNQGNQNHFRKETVPANAAMKGVVFGRSRADDVVNEWDGEFTIAALESSGVEVFHHTEFLADGDGKSIWTPFSKDGTLANTDTSWVSASEKVGGAIAIKFTLQPGEKKIVPMVIAWDFPVVEFGQGRKWNRRYTEFYGAIGNYAYYGTLDVLFYGSMPLLKFWPQIDKQVLREFAATVPREWPEQGLWVWK